MQSFGPNALLECYKQGIFPMSDSRDDKEVFLMDPDQRGIIPLDGLHISRSLKKFIKNSEWVLSYNNDFRAVIRACAAPDKGRENTWISEGLEQLYLSLHAKGYAYSVEIYEQGKLVGGLYGVSIARAFFGESMFSRETNASKVAIVGLVKALNDNKFALLDTQFLTPHLETLGGIEIPRAAYHTRLKDALSGEPMFPSGQIPVAKLLDNRA